MVYFATSGYFSPESNIYLMIKEVSGDIMMSKAELIAQSVAPYDHFDSGLALSLRERTPALFKEFRHFCNTDHPKPGAVWLWKNKTSAHVLNLLIQDAPAGSNHSGRPGKAFLPALNHALQEMKKVAVQKGYHSIALPKLATGVGGLDWEEVRDLIYKVLGDLDAEVYVYSTYVKGLVAGEG
jgi:O-acetyl-ADP-ribose deacetylase (regulator of RNase III)